jgi:hypothetical protein
VTVSSSLPTGSAASTRATLLSVTVTPGRANALNPGSSTRTV